MEHSSWAAGLEDGKKKKVSVIANNGNTALSLVCKYLLLTSICICRFVFTNPNLYLLKFSYIILLFKKDYNFVNTVLSIN